VGWLGYDALAAELVVWRDEEMKQTHQVEAVLGLVCLFLIVGISVCAPTPYPSAARLSRTTTAVK
jgi:hypothetical protein